MITVRVPLFNQSGSSLVELLAAMAAGLVVFSAALQSFSYFNQQFLKQRETIIQAQDVRLSLELLAQELHLASIGSLSVARPDAVEFTANISGLMTKDTAPGLMG
jgi:Tfp pilus assembly protein PilW